MMTPDLQRALKRRQQLLATLMAGSPGAPGSGMLGGRIGRGHAPGGQLTGAAMRQSGPNAELLAIINAMGQGGPPPGAIQRNLNIPLNLQAAAQNNTRTAPIRTLYR